MKLVLLLAACLPPLVANTPAAQRINQLATPAKETGHVAVHPAVGGDLLQQYAARPVGVVFVGCREEKPGGQTIATATYRVSGANSLRVERFFHAQYGMGYLTFLCCGWEPAQGKTGQVASAALRKLNPNYVLLITMYSDAQGD